MYVYIYLYNYSAPRHICTHIVHAYLYNETTLRLVMISIIILGAPHHICTHLVHAYLSSKPNTYSASLRNDLSAYSRCTHCTCISQPTPTVPRLELTLIILGAPRRSCTCVVHVYLCSKASIYTPRLVTIVLSLIQVHPLYMNQHQQHQDLK